MRLDLLPRLACPACGGELAFESLDAMPDAGGNVESGTLACRRCRARYPIEDSVPRLFPPGPTRAAVRRTRRSFAWEWNRYPGSLPEDESVFLEETQFPREALAGSWVLDGGCGMGRYACVSLNLGANVVAFDLSDSLLRLVPLARANARLHLVQGDLHAPPFKPGAFDAAYSQGVLHHTSDARKAFLKLAALVRRDGLISAWVYGDPGSWASFSTNPLKSDRAWLTRCLRAVWLLVWARRLLSDALRVVTTRLPVPVLYALCWPLAFLGMFPILKYLTFSVHPKFKVRWIENFDWLAPPYQSKHTKEELASWFQEAGVAPLSRLPHGVVPKVGALGRKEKV